MLRFYNRLEEVLIATLFAGMTLVTFIQVVLRYVFNTGLLWALEASIYMFAWMVLLGISYGVRERAHIGVDAAVRLLPLRWQRAVGLVGIAVCLVYASYMLYGSWGYVERLHRIGILAEDIPLPRWLLTSGLVIGLVLFILRLLQAAWGIIRGTGAPLLVGDEAKDILEEFESHVKEQGEPR
ncbi:MAG TPA: TRAP transporter small permease [Gammaproteobacteria bacterium]|nr:TRAP transporter small permease [Gammaproteobacteria bacterium]